MFDEDTFVQTCQQLHFPQLDGWEFFTESHLTKIWRLYNETSGLYQYKIYGELTAVTPDVCAAVYMDLDYRRQWDSYVADLFEIEDGDRKGVYWQINFPWPMSNRDYSYVREYRQVAHGDHTVWLVLARAETFSDVPPRDDRGVIRVTDYVQGSAMTSNGRGGTKAFMHYYDDPKGSIPTWLINWGAKTGVPKFLTDMDAACRGYPEYLKKKQRTDQETRECRSEENPGVD